MSFIKRVYNIVSAIIQEIIALIYCSLFFLFDLARHDPKPPMTKTGIPILFVHGYLHNSSAWWFFRRRLTQLGFGPVYTINLGSPFSSIKDYATKVGHKVDDIFAATGAKEVILIGHSMGGLVSAYYALKNQSRVKSVVTLATPMKGALPAYVSVGKAARDMQPNSPFLQELHSGLRELQDVSFLHLGSDVDELVYPKDSALTHFTKDAEVQCVTYHGHLAFLISNQVVDILAVHIANMHEVSDES